jgi:hypothetical protein
LTERVCCLIGKHSRRMLGKMSGLRIQEVAGSSPASCMRKLLQFRPILSAIQAAGLLMVN